MFLIFPQRSYHRTGTESYNAGETFCKGVATFFLHSLYNVKCKKDSVWPPIAKNPPAVDRAKP